LRLTQAHWNPAGRFTFAATGNPNELFMVEASSSPANTGVWTLLVSSRIPAGGEPVYITDPEPPAYGARFYRIRPPP